MCTPPIPTTFTSQTDCQAELMLNNMPGTLAVAIQLVLVCGCLYVDSADADVGAAVDKAMEEGLSRYNIRGASIAYYNGNVMDEPIVRGYGQLSSAAEAPAVDGETVFMIASVSKVFAGVAVSALVDQGVIVRTVTLYLICINF